MAKAILHGAFDESGKFHDKDVVSLCGWISTLQDWERFGFEWNGILSQFGVKEIHTAELLAFKGQYSYLRHKWGKRKDEKRDWLINECIRAIRKDVRRGFGVAIDTKHYRGMSQKFRDKVGDPYLMAFQNVIKWCLDEVEKYAEIKKLGNDVSLALIFDQDEQQSGECLKLLNRITKVDESARKRITGICFCNRRSYTPLQAADLIAYETRMEIDRRMYRPSEPVSLRFMEMSSKVSADRGGGPDGLFNGLIYDAEALENLAVKLGCPQ
jgi:hypothetical protein